MFKIPEWIVFFATQLSRSKAAFLVISLLTIAAVMSGAAAPLLIGRLIDGISLHGGEGILLLSLLLLGALLLTELCFSYRAYISAKAMLRLSYSLTEETLASVLRTSSAFFSKTPRGELLQRCTQDTRVIQQFGLSALPGFIQELLLAVVALVIIFRWNWQLAAILIAAYIVLFIPVHIYGQKRGIARKQLVAHDAHLRQSLLEKLDTVKQTKIYGTEQQESESFRAEQQKWSDLKYQEGLVESMYRTFPRIPDSLAPALIFLFAGWQMIIGEASIGQLVTIIAYIPALNAPVRSFFELYVSLADIKVRIHGIMEYLQLPNEPGRQAGLKQLDSCREQSISFKKVHVAGDRGTDLLHNLSFTISPGEHVAIVGPSGAGKSTLLKLILRLQEPTSGTIEIGGTPLHELDASFLRARIGYMMQEGVWFRDTLYRNLTYLARADRIALDAWMRAFGAEDILTQLPDGYDSVIGQNGDSLSGGQRQLIGFVRTMLKQPDILLLDEATSSLDQKSETNVYQALHTYASGITRINVTHRLRGAALADRILVMNHGEIVQQGTHDELLAVPGLYANLWQQEMDEATRGAESMMREGGAIHERELITGFK
ncbi:ABC-type multidrug transport system fused ATPase/permease subunit [Paenibacillus castaneae]|uniref:ABC transporter ATP-binding protein n=1 Tax=Paenibacillus castaneae TaxID=474957 RepID=UPI000C9B11FD|nr:ABC transporter ATP-binding protein [Paenibacillus castaneae]NIK78867.1 ABC-type multidrug transport system fused ATPase/permease subunit [Paenibacillus castaneae]